jgi:hypothetical protein
LFGARVVGQLEALLVAPAWLPDMDTWYSGLMPYHFLLPAQIAILMLMAVVAWNRRIRGGQFARAHPRVAQALRILAVLYFAVMAIQLAVNINENGADFWREGAIPVAFHWVLALFILVSGRASETMRGMRMPPQHHHQNDEADDIPYGDVPALANPLEHGPGLGAEVRHRHAS